MIDDPARSAGGALGEYAYREGTRDRSTSDVLKDIFGNVQEMIRSEIRLARAEIREEAAKTAASGKMIAVGAVMALFALGFLLTAVAQLLSLIIPPWAASLFVAVALGAAGGAFLISGKKSLTMPVPQKTIENVKENVQWMKNQTKS